MRMSWKVAFPLQEICVVAVMLAKQKQKTWGALQGAQRLTIILAVLKGRIELVRLARRQRAHH